MRKGRANIRRRQENLQSVRNYIVKATKQHGRKKKETRQDFLKRLIVAFNGLDEKSALWKNAPVYVKQWFNDGVDSINNGAAIADFFQYDKLTRIKEVTEMSEELNLIKWDDLEEGMDVLIINRKDEDFEGNVTKLKARMVIIETEEGEKRISKPMVSEIYEVEMANGADEDDDEEEEEAPPPKKARGRGRPPKRQPSRAFEDDDDDDDDEDEKPAPKKRGRGRPRKVVEEVEGNGEDLNEAPPPKKGGRGRKPRGRVSVVQRIREVLCKNPEIEMDEVSEILEDEGLEFKPATVKLTYDSFKSFYELLDKEGRIV